jgi:hypothetical protein
MMKKRKEREKNKRRQDKCIKMLNTQIKWLKSGKIKKNWKRESFYKRFKE